MKNKSTAISFEDVLQNGELSHLHEVVHFLENTKNEPLFPEKYAASIKRSISKKVKVLFVEHPTMPLKKVITIVVNSLPDTLDAKFLLSMTAFIIESWEDLSHSIVSKSAYSV
jgi:uncharacterized protein YjgD (DUF1641 family)